MSARRDQGLAVTAWTLVGGLPDNLRQEFRSQAIRLGPMLVTSGLAATAAFLAAKAGDRDNPLAGAYRALADALAGHVLTQAGEPGRDRNTLVRRVGEMDVAEYRRACADAREFGAWVRRAAEALISARPSTSGAR